MKKSIYFSWSFLAISLTAFAQDVTFFSSNQPLTSINPSFAGSNGLLRVQTSYQQESYRYSNYSDVVFFGGADGYIKRLNAGVGLSVISQSDIGGIYKTTQVNAIYAQHFSLMDNKLKIIPSFQVTYGEKRVDLSHFTFGNMGSTSVWGYTEPKGRKDYFDGSAGLLVNYKNFYGGATVFHLNQPDINLAGTSKLPARFSAYTSYNLHVSERTLINFSARLEAQHAYNYAQLAVNAVLFKHLIAGVGYTPDGYHPLLICLGYRNNFMSASMSYQGDFPTLHGQLPGRAGVNLSYNLRNKEQRKQLTNFESW